MLSNNLSQTLIPSRLPGAIRLITNGLCLYFPSIWRWVNKNPQKTLATPWPAKSNKLTERVFQIPLAETPASHYFATQSVRRTPNDG